MPGNDKTEKHNDKSKKEEHEVTSKEEKDKKETKNDIIQKEPSIKKSKSWQKSVENFFIFWN